jgi:threonine/homoserine/homoserine lactone efflux protein
MTTLVALAALIFVAAITPGPNNLAVLNAAANRGVAGAASAIAGVLLGSLALLALALSGLGALFTAQPRLRDYVSLFGCGYLVWLGAAMIVRSLGDQPGETRVLTPSGIVPLAGLQFANPKAWTMVLTAVAAARGTMEPAAAALVLAALFLAIPAVCLAAWAWFGLRIIPRLQQRATRVWFDRLMGLLLVCSAIVLMRDVTRWSMPQ